MQHSGNSSEQLSILNTKLQDSERYVVQTYRKEGGEGRREGKEGGREGKRGACRVIIFLGGCMYSVML